MRGRRLLARLLQGALLLVLVLTIAVNVVIIVDKSQRLVTLIPTRVQGECRSVEMIHKKNTSLISEKWSTHTTKLLFILKLHP